MFSEHHILPPIHMSNRTVLVIYYRSSTTLSGLDWAVQGVIDRLISKDATVTLIAPASVDLSLITGEPPSTFIVEILRFPESMFAFKNRVVLLHEIEKAINRTGASTALSFGLHHCGYCAAMASRLQGTAHLCVLTYQDLFEYHLNSPQELEFVLASSLAVGSFSGPVVEQAQAFRSAEEIWVLHPPDPPDLRLVPCGPRVIRQDEDQPYLLTCGSLGPLTDLHDLVRRAKRHLSDGVARWIHAGIIDTSILAPFCARLASFGLLDRFSVLGVLERDRLLVIMKRASKVLLSGGEHDTGILARECTILGIPAESSAEPKQLLSAHSIDKFLQQFVR